LSFKAFLTLPKVLPETSEKKSLDLPDHEIIHEERKEDLHLKPEVNFSREKLELNERNLHLYMSKKIEPSILEFKAVKFQSKIQDEDAMVEMTDVNDETLKSLAKATKSAHKVHTLNVDCSR